VFLGFKPWSHLIREEDLSENMPFYMFIKQVSDLNNYPLLCFGSKIQTYLGNIFIVIELNTKDSTILIKLFSFNDSDLCTSLMFYARAILQNL
jgi:hypothetical protein